MSGIDRMGLLNEVTQILSEQLSVNIHKIVITCDENIFDGTLELRVHDRQDVKKIIQSLKKVKDLEDISEIM